VDPRCHRLGMGQGQQLAAENQPLGTEVLDVAA